MSFAIPIAALAGFVLLSIVYVYAWRGEERYANFPQYVRKGWPIFTPLNCLLYLFTRPRARGAMPPLERFPELDRLRDNWELIREEAQALYRSQAFDQTKDPANSSYYDLGFRSFHKYGWSKFYLTWYGTTLNSAQAHCPQTVALVNSIPGVNGAMFSLLPAGSKLTRHADPVACSLRYHLGLDTPEDPACYINIDGRDYVWHNGQALIFDETFLHYAHNDSDKDRLILMCDVNRPTWFPGPLFNGLYRGFMRLSVVPNAPGDQRGLFNNIFAGIAPRLAAVRTLKQTHRARYKLIKYSVNGALFCLLGGLMLGFIHVARSFFTLVT